MEAESAGVTITDAIDYTIREELLLLQDFI